MGFGEKTNEEGFCIDRMDSRTHAWTRGYLSRETRVFSIEVYSAVLKPELAVATLNLERSLQLWSYLLPCKQDDHAVSAYPPVTIGGHAFASTVTFTIPHQLALG